MSAINEIILFELNNAEQILAKNDKFTDQNVQRVLDSGGYRGVKQFIKGLNLGSKNLQKKYGIKEKISWNPFSKEGAYNDPQTNTIHLPFPLWNMSRVHNYSNENPNAGWWDKFKSGFDFSGSITAISRRHETDEARIGRQIADRNGVPLTVPGIDFMTPMDVPNGNEAPIYSPNKTIYYDDELPTLAARTGRHVSPQVLINEKPLVQYISNFPQATHPFALDYRNSSGEYGPSIQDLTPNQVRAIEDQSVKNNVQVDNFARVNNFNQNQYDDFTARFGSKYLMTPYDFDPTNIINAQKLKTPEAIRASIRGYTALAPSGVIQNPNAIGLYT